MALHNAMSRPVSDLSAAHHHRVDVNIPTSGINRKGHEINERSAHEAANGAKTSDRYYDHGVIGTSLAIALAVVRTGARHAALPLHL
jgi:hypothetical protein